MGYMKQLELKIEELAGEILHELGWVMDAPEYKAMETVITNKTIRFIDEEFFLPDLEEAERELADRFDGSRGLA